MSITSAMFSGVSGMLANAEGINVIGNNLANVNTVGFKYNRMLFADMMYVDAGNGSQLGRGTKIDKIDNVMGQGAFENTEVVTDLAIQGEGFFAIGPTTGDDPTVLTLNGSSRFTRAGAFRLGPIVDDGTNQWLPLITPGGNRVLDEGDGDPTAAPPVASTGGYPIFIPTTYTDASANVLTFQKIAAINDDGVISILYANDAGVQAKVYYAGQGTVNPDATLTKKVGYAVVPNPQAMTKEGSNIFSANLTSGDPVIGRANGNNSKIYSNSLEQSNVDMAAQFVKMILTQRAYSANSKTITTADEMTQEVLNLKR